MLKLIDKKQTKKMTVEDTVIHFRSFDNGEKMRLTHVMKGLDAESKGWNECLELVAKVVIKIEGFEEEEISDVLTAIESPKTQFKILIGILKSSGLTDDERKNLESSLDVKLTESESTGNVKQDQEEITDQKSV